MHDNPSDSQGPHQTAGWMCIECPRCGTHLKNYIKITWDELVRMWSMDSHSFWTSWSDNKRHGQFWFSLIFFHYFHYPPDLIRFVACSCHRILRYPACPLRILLLITLRVLSRYGLTLKLALRNVSVRWVCATSVPLGCQGMSGWHWKSDKRSINQVWTYIKKY